jgi:hypothetical protein
MSAGEDLQEIEDPFPRLFLHWPSIQIGGLFAVWLRLPHRMMLVF